MRPLALLLLPRRLEQFILRDQAEDLLAAPGVVALDPPRVPYGALGRLPDLLAARLAYGQARRLVRTLARDGGVPRVVIIFHPFQDVLARAIQGLSGGDCEVWYGRWDRYEHAYDADAGLRERLGRLHERAAGHADLVFVASDELGRLEREAGREPTLVPLAADAFPAPDPTGTVVAASLGHLGWRTDWTLLRAVAERMGERLVLLLIGAWHDDECRDDPDYAWCRRHPGFVWLGARDDAEASRLLLAADVGIVPFKVEPFNDAGLPYRILKYAKLGRRTVSPDLAGVRTWGHAVDVAADAEAFAAALAAQAGARTRPDEELREWALQQVAFKVNRPLWERLRAAGVDTGGR